MKKVKLLPQYAAFIAALQNNAEETMEMTENLTIEVVVKIANALERNTKCKVLKLRYAALNDEGAKALAKALERNTHLQKLYLDNNQIGDLGSKSLGEALDGNRSLQTLHLNNNQIGDEGAKAFGEALETNSSLKELYLSNNQIGDEGATVLGEALETNSSLNDLLIFTQKTILQNQQTSLMDFMRGRLQMELIQLTKNFYKNMEKILIP